MTSSDKKKAEKQAVPLPLPHDVDLSGMPYMQLHDTRLMRSKAWLQAKNWRDGGPGLAFCLLNLWVAAFRDVPAGSLEDDDDMLADAARCDIDFWHKIKTKATRGWERHGNRLYHPVICDMAWDLWLSRLAAKHEAAVNSHRAAAKRAMDKAMEPPDPPGGFVTWLQANYPATAAYRHALLSANTEPLSEERTPDIPECSPHNEPKRSEDKHIPPLTPQASAADKPAGKDGRSGKSWYRSELARLDNEFGQMAPTMRTYLQQPGVSGEFGFVKTFKGCWMQPGERGKAEILVPTKPRANAIIAQHGEWLRHYWPELGIRHARVDELRAFAARGLS